ncbi:makorin, ring finger protein, 4 isoform X2 [Phyllopteryx taeniolatus]|uniref:makorin, ring finger protein, 4 isoform X2 n=1 Tax=Phyllopteryx taeniolatus TaxID=161469 RepID=UPI002AD21480|nr:makorin, ring finger protein, 4 isoform X2 [Phyllopteryx taeniolatus]
MERSLSTRNGNICWHFLNGSCRYGSRCHYRHELPATQPSQICRYFQKGACWYGEHCRYIHVPQPEGGADVAGRRLSVPTVSSSTSTAARGPADRRGSETSALAQADVLPRRQRRTSRSVENSSNVTDAGNQNAEKRLQDAPSRMSAKSSEQCCASPRGKEESLPGSTQAAGAAAAPCTDRTAEAYLQSRDVTCGICMDKVYEKMDRSKRVFGILPNCSHAFCLQCIMTWRKTRDLGPDVVKSGPSGRTTTYEEGRTTQPRSTDPGTRPTLHIPASTHYLPQSVGGRPPANSGMRRAPLHASVLTMQIDLKCEKLGGKKGK